MSTASTDRFRRGWEYYRRYTERRTGIHAAATAALTGLGLLAYFEPWFVAVAIMAYLLPPVYLYLAGDDLAEHDQPSDDSDARRDTVDADRDFDGFDADFDADGDDSDADFGGFDGDADADGADADADGADVDADGIDIDRDG
jgi:hypothetical protein